LKNLAARGKSMLSRALFPFRFFFFPQIREVKFAKIAVDLAFSKISAAVWANIFFHFNLNL
jgi:hypothetical protein